MPKPTVGRINNYGGIVNLGEIHGNVTSIIRGRLEHAQSAGAPNAEVLQALLVLVDEIRAHSSALEDPAGALQSVQEMTSAIDVDPPERPVIERCLGFLALGLARMPALLERVLSIKNLVAQLLG